MVAQVLNIDSIAMWASFAVIVIAIVLFATEVVSLELVALGAIVLLMTVGLLAPDSGLEVDALLSGFSNPALLTILALLVIGQALFQTDALGGLTKTFERLWPRHPRRVIPLILVIAGLASAFINNTPVVVMFIPLLTAVAARRKLPTPKMMMPLSFISILGGMTTLIGSSTNLLVNDAYTRITGSSLEFFTQFGPGIFLAAIGAAYIVIFAPILLPKRENLEDEVSEGGRQYIAQIRVSGDHPLNGVTPKAGLFPSLKDVTVRMVQRGDIQGFEVIVGGGLGRTPMLGKVIADFLPREDLLPYLEAIVSVYNLLGRRDNKYKARIKITVHENGLEKIRALVEERFTAIKARFSGIDQELLKTIEAGFKAPAFKTASTQPFDAAYKVDPVFRAWADTNLHAHKADGYSIVTVSLKAHGATPGDATAAQMRTLADLAKRFGHDELRISHEQNVILPHVHKSDLPAMYAALRKAGLSTANIGLISDIIA
ncbi:SLC13 family permease, partial [uncultured Maritalea sp.]|uniref:SLC13 family permease n=1 Tax=uncultured Maritalea sp. TaxID=757249 RepID=UPI002613E379